MARTTRPRPRCRVKLPIRPGQSLESLARTALLLDRWWHAFRGFKPKSRGSAARLWLELRVFARLCPYRPRPSLRIRAPSRDLQVEPVSPPAIAFDQGAPSRIPTEQMSQALPGGRRTGRMVQAHRPERSKAADQLGTVGF